MARQRADERRGPDRSPSGPREANDPGSTRYGTNAGSGSNEPKHNERKEERGFVSRQGRDQTRPGGTDQPEPAEDER
ncbi:MAG TPA: hypothetical protein VFO73_11545 [Candidatus Limnocylindrales bacterium]|nr:hypothetical protein [Candidatus Limnocylindrales bacterium]